MPSRLSPLQDAILAAFFAEERRFHLTGGAALAGFHLGHRVTHDLDLFTAEDILEAGDAALRRAAEVVGGTVENLTTAPTFRRRLIRCAEGSVVVDLVRDRSTSGGGEKIETGGILLDAPQEILAAKLCALLSRSEIRDLVDVLFLERSGLDVVQALERARDKDAGLTPALLASVLSEIEIGSDARIPGGVSATELREYLGELCRRLRRWAFP